MEFPRALPELAWGEAELLCRVLAELTRDVRPPPDPGAPGDGAAAPAGQRDSGARER
jgi:hypothetical protein